VSGSMTVHFVTRTGNVLAAATRVADPGQAAGKESVLVRGFSAGPFLVPATEMSTLAGDPDLALLLAPRSFHVPAQGSKAEPLPNTAVTSIVLSPAQVTVGVTSVVSADTAVWVLIAGGSLLRPVVVAGTLPNGQSSVNLPLEQLAAGTYHTLALVRGHQPLTNTSMVV
jgi:hypothetical protein